MKTFILLSIFYFFTPVLACPLLETPSQHYSTSFVQKRHINGLKVPIVSEGKFEIFPGEKVLWKTLSPFESTVVIDAEGFTVDEKKYDNSRIQELSKILLEIHSGNFKGLKNRFDYQCKEQDNGVFRLSVVPLESKLKRVFTSIELEGQSRPDKIRFTDSRGDKTEIDFSK